MKVFNAVVSFKIVNKFSKENFENEIMDYSDEIEDLLDYDCLVFDPEVISEEEDSVTVSIPVDAYIEIIDEKDQVNGEEEIRKEIDGGAFQLQIKLEDGLNGNIAITEVNYATISFKDIYAYKDWVMQASIMSLLKNDSDFEESFPYLVLDSYDAEITGIHRTENGVYVQGIDDDGEHFNLALKFVKEKNDEDLFLLSKHMDDVYPEGHQYFLEVVEDGKSDEDWSIINDSEDDFYNTYFRVLSLKDVDEGDDGFYAADSLLCCIDDEYESKIDEGYYDFDEDFDDSDDE